MDFFEGLTDELVKLAGEEGDTMYGHGDGEKKPSTLKGMAVGAAGGAAAHGAIAEGMRRAKRTPFDLADKMREGLGNAFRPGISRGEYKSIAEAANAAELLRTGGKAGPWHKAMAKHLPMAMLLGAAGGAGIQGIRRAMHHGEKKEAGVMGGIRKVVAKVPKKAVGAGLAAGGAFGVGHHMGKKKGEGEAVQVGEAAYGAGARDMANELMSELGMG